MEQRDPRPGRLRRLAGAHFVLAGIMLGTAVASADYSTCMTFCLDEHNFSYCHPVCEGNASAPTAADNCYSHTTDQKHDSVLDWIAQHYDWLGAATSPIDDEGLFEVDIAVYPDDYCRVRVMVDDGCGVSVVEVVEGDAC